MYNYQRFQNFVNMILLREGGLRRWLFCVVLLFGCDAHCTGNSCWAVEQGGDNNFTGRGSSLFKQEENFHSDTIYLSVCATSSLSFSLSIFSINPIPPLNVSSHLIFVLIWLLARLIIKYEICQTFYRYS